MSHHIIIKIIFILCTFTTSYIILSLISDIDTFVCACMSSRRWYTHTHTHTVGDTGAIHGYHLLVAARLAISDGKPILFFHSFLSLFVTSGQSKDKVWRTIYLYIYIYIYVACKRQKKDRKGRTYLATRGPPGAAP